MSGKRYKALLQERADLVKEQKDIFESVEREGRELTAEEKTRDDAIAARLGSLADDIAREERRREHERTVEARPIGGVNASSLDAIEGERDEHHPFKTLGEQLGAVVQAAQAPAYADPRLEKYNQLRAATGMHEGSLDAGGAFVQTEFGMNLMERTYATGQVLARIPDQPIGPNANAYSALLIKETSRATGSRYGGLRVYRTGEGATITPSRPEFDRKEFRPYELAALCYLTNTMMQDAVQVEGHVNRLFPLESAFVMENELFNGTGTGQSLGLLNAPATVSIAKETGQAAATILYANLVKMWAQLWSGSENGAVWYANKNIFSQLMQLSQPAGAGALPAKGIEFVNGKFNIFGAPVVFVEYAQTLGTTGDIYLADFGQYLGVRKGGLEYATSIHVAFVTNETALRFTWRFAAEPLWRSSLTPLNGSVNFSPFVKLDTRA